MSQVETCANCGGTIGRLETPCIWQEHVVCGTCYLKLSTPVLPTTPVSRPTPMPAVQEWRPSGRTDRVPRGGFLDLGRNKSVGATLFRVFFWIAAAVIILGILSQIEWANRMGGR